jgi:hypothetical protein
MSYHLDPVKAERVANADSRMFVRRIGEAGRVSASIHHVNNSAFKIIAATDDPEAPIKKFSVFQAVHMVTKRGFKLPADTEFLFSGQIHHQNQAFHFNFGGHPVCWVSLGPSANQGGSGRGISAQSTPGYNSATKITLHEFGHMFHAHSVGRTRFYSDKRLKDRKPAIGTQVSDYASNNICKEIIAETFLGMMIGREYHPEVIQYYATNGGARIIAGAGKDGFGIL